MKVFFILLVCAAGVIADDLHSERQAERGLGYSHNDHNNYNLGQSNNYGGHGNYDGSPKQAVVQLGGYGQQTQIVTLGSSSSASVIPTVQTYRVPSYGYGNVYGNNYGNGYDNHGLQGGYRPLLGLGQGHGGHTNRF